MTESVLPVFKDSCCNPHIIDIKPMNTGITKQNKKKKEEKANRTSAVYKTIPESKTRIKHCNVFPVVQKHEMIFVSPLYHLKTSKRHCL